MRAVGERLSAWVQAHPGRVGALIWAIFTLLVAAGVTGSSWPLLAQGPEAALVQWRGSTATVLAPRYIRSDEWGILTTNALAQWNHVPRFPVVNDHLGVQGQNMGVVGMTGTPVAQLAVLARPATWGYFFLPLRQAMAWHWQFPFFACLFFLWLALRLLLPTRSALALVLAGSFCVAPYAAGWSLWPLYATAFPAALWVALAALARTARLPRALALGMAMGLALAGWVLVLYPPWQITLGWCTAALVTGWLLDQRHTLRWRTPQWLGLLLALALAGALLGSWWQDTADAVARLQATVYPGLRDAQTGADIAGAPWWTLRGYLDAQVMWGGMAPDAAARMPEAYANESELSAFILLPLPLLLLALWQATRAHPLRWTLRACLAFVAFWLVFRFIGIPAWLAHASLWSRVTGARLDLSLGLACTVLFALLAAGWSTPPWSGARIRPAGAVAASVALASAALVLLEFALWPAGTLQGEGAWARPTMALGVAACTWWLMRGHMAPAATLWLALGAAATLPFNPWSRAPRSVALAPEVASLASDDGQLQRTLALGGDAKAAVTLLAAGVPVVNGVLYYPQPRLWQNMGMGLAGDDWNEVNRYQHLTFVTTTLPPHTPAWRVEGSLDRVRVELDPMRFDFASTGAQRVLARGEDAQRLRQSPRLHALGEVNGWVWFAPVNRTGLP